MDETRFNIAVLIDGDNSQPKLLQAILEEVSKYGKATVRRIYGDWTENHMNGWKEKLNHYSFNPIQKFSYTIGKNSTDSSLIIDAMDILHSKMVNGFCIVSSDSDYTGLAKRIREEGIFVMGIGEKKTPDAFVQSCEIFTYLENIAPRSYFNGKSNNKNESDKTLNMDIIDKAFDISAGEEEEVYIAEVGINLRKIDPSFDPRAYGFRNLTQLFQSLSQYKVLRNEVNGLNQPLVKLK